MNRVIGIAAFALISASSFAASPTLQPNIVIASKQNCSLYPILNLTDPRSVCDSANDADTAGNCMSSAVYIINHCATLGTATEESALPPEPKMQATTPNNNQQMNSVAPVQALPQANLIMGRKNHAGFKPFTFGATNPKQKQPSLLLTQPYR